MHITPWLRASAGLAAGLLLIPAHAPAKTPAAAPTPGDVQCTAEQVEDMRTTSGYRNGCRVTLTFFGDDVADVGWIWRARATTALDELNRDLLSPTAFPMMSPGPMGMGALAPLRTVITLRNPSRRSATIKLLEGTVDFFTPTEQNGGAVRITSPLAHPGSPLANDVLARYGIAITYLSPAEAAARGGPMVSPLDPAEQQRMQAVATEIARRRALRGVNQGGQPLAEPPPAEPGLPPSHASYSVTTTTTSTGTIVSTATHRLTFEVKDPQDKVVDLVLQDGNGGVVRTFGTLRSGALRGFTLAAPAPADLQLVVYVATPEAVTTRIFHLENIPLP